MAPNNSHALEPENASLYGKKDFASGIQLRISRWRVGILSYAGGIDVITSVLIRGRRKI